jgi:hypothetical protein
VRSGPHWEWEVCISILDQLVLSLWGPVLSDSGRCVYLLYISSCFLCEVRSSLTVGGVCIYSISGSAFFVRSGPHWEWEVCVSTLYQLVLSLWGLVLTNGGRCVYLFYISWCFLCEAGSSLKVGSIYVYSTWGIAYFVRTSPDAHVYCFWKVQPSNWPPEYLCLFSWLLVWGPIFTDSGTCIHVLY